MGAFNVHIPGRCRMVSDPVFSSGPVRRFSHRLAMTREVARRGAALPNLVARGLLVWDLNTWLRLQFLGVASRVGIAAALQEPGDLASVAARAEITDLELLEAFLALGVSLREVA